MDNVPFPRFTSDYYTVWFAQMEAAFAANSVEDSDKYGYIITHIPTAALTLVEDILLSPPTADQYENFKYEFIKRLTLQQLKSLPFGNEKPSEYLRKLIKVAGRRISNEVVLNIWQNNLPEKVRQILSLETSRNMDRLSEMADLVMAIARPPPLQISNGVCEKQVGVLTQRLDAIEKQVQFMKRIIDGEYIEAEEPQPQQNNSLEISKVRN
ncbi:unnamed protein product [Spodoptera exigua]|nr:unnamed protein product [Spodoptera exigua]